MKILALLLFILSASINTTYAQVQKSSLEFTPRAGFSGQSEGNGKLKLFFGKRRSFHVESRGYEQADGTFRLDQIVTFEGQPSEQRTWLLKSTSQNHYAGMLSDAAGRVTGQTNGSVLKLKYRLKGPLVMHQTLKLMDDGKTIDNVGKIKFLGITVGRLHETIVRKD